MIFVFVVMVMVIVVGAAAVLVVARVVLFYSILFCFYARLALTSSSTNLLDTLFGQLHDNVYVLSTATQATANNGTTNRLLVAKIIYCAANWR